MGRKRGIRRDSFVDEQQVYKIVELGIFVDLLWGEDLT